jgi:signal transduction histidine kinase
VDARGANHRVDEVFLRNSSEALRTRFTTLKGYWQLLDRRQRRENPDWTQLDTRLLSNRVQTEVDRFEHLLMQYLDAVQLQWGRAVNQRVPVELSELTRAAVSEIQQRGIVSKRHRLQIEVREPISGNWDGRWLQDALVHIVANAVLYAPAGGEVLIRIERTGNTARIGVHDQGIGVTADEQELIFQPFYRGRRIRDQVPGLGLGLFIASSVVAHHGGTVHMISQPGDGSTFSLHLPIDRVDPHRSSD